MKRKIVKYLNSKDKSNYSKLDFIFEDYLSGRLKQLLIDRGFKHIEIFYQINKKLGNYIDIDCKYCSFNITLIFENTEYFQSIYLPYCSFEELEKGEKYLQYEDDFTIEKYLDNLSCVLNEK